MIHQSIPHSSFRWRTKPDEIRDKKRNTAKRSSCLFVFDRPPIDKTQRRVERDRTTDLSKFWGTSKNKPDQTAAQFSYQAWVFRVTSERFNFRVSPSMKTRQTSTVLTPPSSSLSCVRDYPWSTGDGCVLTTLESGKFLRGINWTCYKA